jgi:hypothetical protein
MQSDIEAAARAVKLRPQQSIDLWLIHRADTYSHLAQESKRLITNPPSVTKLDVQRIVIKNAGKTPQM